ncbi:uncharacterized membrane protein (DUF485 family) [Virgibacillus natechei]|uniref:Uncharacterized membrane protein (DUF485 family) n=1 Tax=Virgibacillus natechei TaxID=1216297 RepID=A0ABS4IF57_9BACI|nr:uncharacterized membrane protein (DUF485 family) [Virgibacillus natechei]
MRTNSSLIKTNPPYKSFSKKMAYFYIIIGILSFFFLYYYVGITMILSFLISFSLIFMGRSALKKQKKKSKVK